MFTGIVQGVARIASLEEREGLCTTLLEFPEGFCEGLAVGASVSVDGMCLTVTQVQSPVLASFDVILQSLRVTCFGDYLANGRVNVERAARDGAEIGGHPLSGHIDFSSGIEAILEDQGNKVLRISIPPEFRRYIFPKGYIAINGCSLTVSACDKGAGWFEVWLIPETRRVTTLDAKRVGDRLNIEIERGTQVVVDTVRDAVEESLGRLRPVLEALLEEKGLKLEDFVDVTKVAPPRLS